ncbi:MAG TPA: hypothetical protein VGN16_10150 [Acidobacteriaceae bacterium]
MTSSFTSASPLRSGAISAAIFFAVVSLAAQTHHVEAPQRVTRAVAVYEWTGDLDKPKAARLVPVSLFINGHLEDASVYLARPVPFALETGDLYDVEKAGEGKGLFAVDHARHVLPPQDPNAQSGGGIWYAYGRFTPPKPAPKPPVLHASTQLSTIVSSSDSSKPHFGSKPAADTSTTPQPSSSDKTPAKDSNRPQLKRPADTNGASTSSTDSQNSQPAAASKDSAKAGSDGKAGDKDKDNDPERPTLQRRDPAQDAQRRAATRQSGVTGPEVSLNDDPDRPTIRRGAAPGLASTEELTGLPADMHQVAAVSDPATRDTHIFAREWESPTERAETLAKFEAIARPRITAYANAYQLTLGTPLLATPATAAAAGPVPAAGSSATPAETEPPKLQRGVPKDYQTPKPVKPATKSAATTAKARATRAAAAKAKAAAPSLLALNNEQLTPFTLSYGGVPTFVYTAQADLRTGGPVYLTLVAQRMVSGDLQIALSSITDAAHLDRTPWLRLVDAVDPDAGHRASLLFELRGQNNRQFALYRLTSAQAEQIFTTGTM